MSSSAGLWFPLLADSRQLRPAFGLSLPDVVFHDLLPFALRPEDELDSVAEGAVATSMRRDVMGLLFHFSASVFYGNGEAPGTHVGKVDDVIADEGGLFWLEALLVNDFLETGAFVSNTLMHVFEFQIASAQRDRF